VRRRVGKALACPPSNTEFDDGWWARRKRAFAYPTMQSLAPQIFANQPKQKKPTKPTTINAAPVTSMTVAKRMAECSFDACTVRSEPRA
jgi:hypothetical protein